MTNRRAQRIQGMPETVFSRYAKLALQTGAVNLGQGFPEDPPDPIVQAAWSNALHSGHQYPPRLGTQTLREAIARLASERDRTPIDPNTQVLVTVGATEALYAALHAFINPGDEALLLTPCYDAYPFMVRLAGGTPVAVPLVRAGEGWSIDLDALDQAVTPRTRLLLLNDPHNPTGTVLDAATMQALCAWVEARDLLLIVDQVYEHVAFTPTHAPAAACFARTLAIGSAGKTFGVTGWKIGWATGPAELVAAVADVHQWISYTVANPLQQAVAELLNAVGQGGSVDAMLERQRQGLRARRDTLLAALQAAGAKPTTPQSGYFIHADVSAWGVASDGDLCDALPALAGVVAIPGSAFEVHTHARPETWVRFAYCKGDATVGEGARRLRAWRAHP